MASVFTLVLVLRQSSENRSVYLVVSPQFGDLLKCSIMDVHIAKKYFLQLFQKTFHTAGILHTDQCIPRPKYIVGQIDILYSNTNSNNFIFSAFHLKQYTSYTYGKEQIAVYLPFKIANIMAHMQAEL